MIKVFTFLVVIIFVFTAFPVHAGNWKFYVFGVDLDWVKEKKIALIGLGMLSSIVGHKLGHMGYLTLNNKHYRIEANLFLDPHIIHEELSPVERRHFGRAGFVLQSAVGVFLTTWERTRHSSFTQGWVAMTDVQLGLYHAWHKDWGDFGTIQDAGGNRIREYNIFCGVAAYNTLRLR